MNRIALYVEKRSPFKARSKNKFSPGRWLLSFILLFQVFLVNGQAPTITGLSSNICAGGSITITGTNFIGITASNVTIGGTAVSSISSFTGTQIIAVVNTASSGKVKVTTSNGTATSSGTFTSYAIPAAPGVTTPINYCLNAVASQLTATGTNLTWGGGTISGTAGGSSVLSGLTYVSNPYSNKETNFTTTAANVEITTVDCYIPAYQSVSGLQLALYNSSGTVVATSSTITSSSGGSTGVIISNTFNYTIAVAGNYSIGIAAGTGTVGGDSPTFPITEPTGTINVTGTNSLGTAPYHCFNNIQFTVNGSSSTAPTPSTSSTGTTNYLVSQTVNGCVSSEATIAVIVNAAPSATISYGGSPFCKSLGSAQAVTRTGTSGGTYSASPSGLSINASTGAITPSSSTAGTYTVTYTMAASGGCSAKTATTSVIITAIPSATISYGGSPFCISVATGQSVTQSGTSGGTYSASPSGLTINSSTGAVTPSSSTAGTYTVTYTMAASGGCSAQTATTSVIITTIPSATISYGGSPFCKSVGSAQAVTHSGTSGGSYSATPSGLTINSSTGAITPSSSTAGTYTVTYTMAATGGCSAQTATTSVTITSTPSATISYSGSPFCINSGSVSVTRTGTSGGTYSSTPGLTINSSTGAINLNSSSAGTYTVTYTIAASGGCAIYTTTTSITITPSVGTPVFALGSSSTRCQGTGSVTYNATASNSTGITYSLDASSISAGNSINSSTGAVTYTSSWNGTSTITATATGCNGPAVSSHLATTGTIPTVSATTTYTCVGGSSGTITASGSGGSTPYTYNLNGGTYQTSTLFTGLAAGTYTLGIQSNTGCTASTSVTVSPYPNSTDDQTLAGTNTWVGHMYSGMNFDNYIGHFTEAETFDEGFGGDYNCFTVSSGATYPSIYTEQFSVRFRMNSTRQGLYVVDLGSDDGSRLYVDGTLIYNNWVDQSFSTRSSVLMNLTGSSSLVYEYYEHFINNRVIFNNLQLILANSLSTNTTQSICIGSSGSPISGDSYGTLPSGISLSGSGYQWTYSTTPTGTRTNISGATSATYTPNTSVAPFNVAGNYYIFRDALVSSSNNIGESPYLASNESNAATITVNSVSVGGAVNPNATVCSGANSGTVYLTGQTGNVVKWQYSTDGGATWTDIVNTTTSQTYTNLTQTTIGMAVVQSGACPSANSTPVTITVEPKGSWSGSVSADWNDSRNWICGQVPTSAINVTIQSGASNYPVISSGFAYANNITIQSGGSLAVAGGDLQIFGAITNNSGTFDATAGTIEMKGAAAQTIDGSAFYDNAINNLIVSNSGSGLSVASTASDTLKITGTLTFGNSASTLNTGDNITLVSNSAATASVGIVGSGNTINGNVTIERYINVGTASGQHAKSWQFLATPTIGQTVKESWMENGATPVGYGTQITGTGTGFDATTATPSLKYYNPASNSWTGVTGTGISIYNPEGYMVFVRGDRSVTSVSQPANTTTLRTKGTLLTGTLSPISVTPDEYASIGNPYASPVDFTLITKGAAIDDQFYVWDPYLYGSYGVGGYQTLSSANEFKPVPGGTSAYSSGTPYYILQSGQAFFVHSTSNPSYTAPDYNLTFSENSKSNSTSVNFSRMSGLTVPSGRAFFGVSLYTGNTIADGNTVAFDRNFSDNVDGNDALKLINGGENFGLKRNGKLLAIEARSPVVVTDTLYYYMTNLQQKAYQLRFAPVNMVATGLQAFLVDNFLNTSTPVSLSDSSFINITVTSNPASSSSGRFDVVFRTLSITPVTFTSITAVQKNADIEVAWSVENESGIRQYEVEESGDGNQFTQVATVAPQNNGSGNYSWLDLNVTPGYHYYRVRSVGRDGQIQYTEIVKVLIGNLGASISIYPNPIINGDIHLQLNNQPTGVYGIRLLNSLGQVIVSKVINHTNGSSNEDLSTDHTLSKGVYQVEISKPDGTVNVVKVVY